MGTMGNKINQNMIMHNAIELKELMEFFLGEHYWEHYWEQVGEQNIKTQKIDFFFNGF
jgi:hypothetical protein